MAQSVQDCSRWVLSVVSVKEAVRAVPISIWANWNTAIIFGPYFGSLADKMGRRPTYALCLLGMILHLAFLYLTCQNPQVPA